MAGPSPSAAPLRGRVRLELERPWAELVLDRPQRRNAISRPMVDDLEQAVDRLAGWQGAAILLRGEGDSAFCSGSDLDEVRASFPAPGSALELCRRMDEILTRLWRLPLLRVAAVEGAALGGGAEILVTCDRIIAGEGATIGFVHAALGVSPGWGGGRRLVDRVGRRRAAVLLAEARRLPAPEALQLGLVDKVVGQGEALEAARSWLAALHARGPAVLRGVIGVALSEDKDDERRIFESLWAGPEHQRALLPEGSPDH